jgi:hypothetical protein
MVFADVSTQKLHLQMLKLDVSSALIRLALPDSQAGNMYSQILFIVSTIPVYITLAMIILLLLSRTIVFD